MFKRRWLTPDLLNVVLFAVLLTLSLWTATDLSSWKGYPDAYDYLQQSRFPLTSSAFWMPEKTEHFSPRPFTVPLFYKLAQSTPETIIAMQKFMHAFSSLMLAFAVIPTFRSDYAKYLFVAAWYLLMSWWNILGWTDLVLSESLSCSLMFMWLGSFIYLCEKPTITRILLHATFTALLSFSRDSWPAFLVFFYALYLLAALVSEKRLWRLCAGMLVLSGVLAVTQHHMAMTGQRFRLPVMNNIVLRVLPHPEYVAWFEEHGMPDAAMLKERYGDLTADSFKIYSLYNNPEFGRFSEWVSMRGNNVYFRFLLAHPECLFLMRENRSVRLQMQSYNFGYIGDPRGISVVVQNIFPFRLERLLVVLGLFLYLSWREQSNAWVLPVILSLSFAFNAWLVFVADAMEIQRHEYLTVVIMQFLFLLLFIRLLDTGAVHRFIDRYGIRWRHD